ncbi:MAG: XRE family transcriptional regulator [Bacteroidales bacterium]|nr:XRE family transcriptional regulator [Bacteroidales bacterium]
MKEKTLQFLESHSDGKPSRFEERARWRRENQSWLEMSRKVALGLIGYMEDNHIGRLELAALLGISNQYLGRLLSGMENLSFKSVADLQDKLGLKYFKPEEIYS